MMQLLSSFSKWLVEYLIKESRVRIYSLLFCTFFGSSFLIFWLPFSLGPLVVNLLIFSSYLLFPFQKSKVSGKEPSCRSHSAIHVRYYQLHDIINFRSEWCDYCVGLWYLPRPFQLLQLVYYRSNFYWVHLCWFRVAFQTISFIAESFVFIYLGISCIHYIHDFTISLSFVLLELVICAFARFFTIFGLSYLVKMCMKKWKVSFYELLIISFAGTIRGSVAFALILKLDHN